METLSKQPYSLNLGGSVPSVSEDFLIYPQGGSPLT